MHFPLKWRLLILLLYIIRFGGYQVRKASINDPNISDEQIDNILWAFFEDWDIGVDALKLRDVQKFLSIMEKIGRLFIRIDSDKAMHRFQKRLDLIVESLIQGRYPDKFRSTISASRKSRTEL